MDREIDLFHEVLDRPQAERMAFVRERHADNPKLAERLIRLVQAHERAEDRSKTGSPDIGSAVLPTPTALPEKIGPYRVLERLGEGGIGIVYAAEQGEPLRRRVAVKVVKLGMDTNEVIARFEAERQALALMDHPCVAKAIDAGATAEGRPYFVMELVKGVALTDYWKKHRLPLRERLQLFIQICGAVQHAHQKGIIHRDLKPSNILVTVLDGKPVPKVIDFGVAKATASRLTEHTIFTEHGRLIGTPEYMSPEQAEMSRLDIDTRSDVYSLGVVLYELIAETLPFDSKQMRTAGYSELLHTIRETTPLKPSTRLLQRADDNEPESHAATAARGPAPAVPVAPDRHKQARSVRGELDWIVMRAIEKDRTRRYGTANELAEDVERFLEQRTVLARPPSALYAARKFLVRNRLAAVLLLLVVLSTIGGLTGLTVGMLRARNAEELAVQRADHAQAAAGFLKRVLFEADPENSGQEPTLTQVMDSAGRRIEQQLAPYPEVAASVSESLGVAYRRRSMFASALPHLRRSLKLRQASLGESHIATANSHIALAALWFEHRGSIQAALAGLRRAESIYLQAGLADSISNGWLQLDIGLVALAGDRLDEAEQALKLCRDLLAADLGQRHPDLSRPLRALATTALRRGDAATARSWAEDAVALCTDQAQTYLEARAQLVLVQVLLAQNLPEAAAANLANVRTAFEATVGSQHIRVAEADACAAQLHLLEERFGKAEQAAARCQILRDHLLAEGHWATLEARLLVQQARLGAQESSAGTADSVRSELAEIAAALGDELVADHPLALQVASTRSRCEQFAGDEAAAERWRKRAESLRTSRIRRLQKGR
ncbi:MAG: protein kinase [Planctomycetota bacterium]